MDEIYNIKDPIRVVIFNHTVYSDKKFKERPSVIGDKFEDFCKAALGEHAKIDHFLNLKRAEISRNLKKISDENNYSSLILCVSSHGNTHTFQNGNFNEVFSAFDGPYKKSNLWTPFKNKKNWYGKPKLFFIQACRGNDSTAGAVLSHDASPWHELPEFTEPRCPDMFIMDACQPGTLSWKNGCGAFFIDAVTEIFMKKISELDLFSMAVEICDSVAKRHEVCPSKLSINDSPDYDCSQQMVCFETTLTKKFFFKHPETFVKDEFYTINNKPLAISLNYSYKEIKYAYIIENERVLQDALIKAGFMYEGFWDIPKKDFARTLKEYYQKNNSDMILIIFNGYGDRDELYLNDEKIKVYELWEPLLPDVKSGEMLSGKPKMCIISAYPVENCMEGVSGKIDKLCKTPDDGNVHKCQHQLNKLNKGQVNVPITADLLVFYDTSSGKYNHKFRGCKGSHFIKMFSEELMIEHHNDFLSLFTRVANRIVKLDKRFNEEVPLAFSTLRKLVPVEFTD